MQFSITLQQDTEQTYLASDLGFLLHKNPHNTFNKDLKFGVAHVLYPHATDDTCTACLHVDIDSLNLVRNYQAPNSRRELKQYVNDRPYAVNSFMSVAISRVFGTALGGTCNKKPELVKRNLPFTVHIPVPPSRGGPQLISELFEPLGYAVKADAYVYDEALAQWGNSRYCNVQLSGNLNLSALLKHLYVLIPVLDDEKHYWVGEDEIDKLMRHAGDWVADHPAKELIVSRYLKKQGSLTKQALQLLAVDEERLNDMQANDTASMDDAELVAQKGEDKLEKKLRLNDLRVTKVLQTAQALEVSSVLDFGCGEGKYLKRYLMEPTIKKVTGMDVSPSELRKAEQRMHIERMPERAREKLQLLQGSLTYFDKRAQGYDLATCVEVIEHIDEERLDAFKASLFGYAAPRNVILTTPNAEYNALFTTMAADTMRHTDHRFEWDRKTFARWCEAIAEDYDYAVSFDGIGESEPDYGSPTQMAIFQKR